MSAGSGGDSGWTEAAAAVVSTAHVTCSPSAYHLVHSMLAVHTHHAVRGVDSSWLRTCSGPPSSRHPAQPLTSDVPDLHRTHPHPLVSDRQAVVNAVFHYLSGGSYQASLHTAVTRVTAGTGTCRRWCVARPALAKQCSSRTCCGRYCSTALARTCPSCTSVHQHQPSGPDDVLVLMNTQHGRIQLVTHYISTPSAVSAAMRAAVHKVTRKASTWMLLDAYKQEGQAECIANTVLVTSSHCADVAFIGDYAKHAQLSTRWMPLWTVAELQLCRAQCYPHIPEEHVRRVATFTGAIPRHTFYLPSRTTMDIVCAQHCEAAMRALPTGSDALARIVRAAHDSTNRNEVSHCILHFRVRDSRVDVNDDEEAKMVPAYTRPICHFASAWVEQETLALMERSYRLHTIELINIDTTSADNRRLLFEMFAHKQLPLSRAWRVCSLEVANSPILNLSLPARPVRLYHVHRV